MKRVTILDSVVKEEVTFKLKPLRYNWQMQKPNEAPSRHKEHKEQRP